MTVLAKAPLNELGAPLVPTNELGDPLPVQEEAPVAKVPTPGEQQIQNDQQQLQKVRWAQANPWGTENNHPGKIGKIAHVLSVAGNLAGDILAPAVTANIPGSQLNMQDKEAGLAKRLNTEITDESQNQERGATQANLESETEDRPGNDLTRRTLERAQADNLNSEVSARQEPSLANAYAHAVNEAIKNGIDPAQDPIVQHLSDAITSLQKQPTEQGVGRTTDLKGPDGRVHTMGYDTKTGKYDIDEGESGFKPQVVNVNAGRAENRQERNDLLKAYQPTLDSAERMNVMTESYEKAIKDHDQQAMLNLLANHLGMTMGLQKGARITRDLYQEAAHSTPWLAQIGAKFDKDGYLAGVTLNPGQMRQMVDLAQNRYQEDAKKSRSTGAYLGAQDDGPQRIAGPATMRFYIGKAGGDPQRAKQLAAADGWSVQ